MKKIVTFLIMFFASLSFVCAATTDTTAPVLNSIKSINSEFNGGDKVGFEIDASDDISGINSIVLTFVKKDSNPYWGTQFIVGLYDSSVTFTDGREGLNDFINGSKTYYGYVSYDVENGEYYLFSVNISDKVGNWTNYRVLDDMGDRKGYVQKDFGISNIKVNEFDGDKKAPELKSLELSSTKVKTNEEITITATIEDESVVEEAKIVFGMTFVELNYDHDNVYIGKVSFDTPGKYEFAQLTMYDEYYHYSNYFYKKNDKGFTTVGEESYYTIEDNIYDIVVVDNDGNEEIELPQINDVKITKSKSSIPSVFYIYLYADDGYRTSLVLNSEKGIVISNEGYDTDHYVFKVDVNQYANVGTYNINLIYIYLSNGKSIVYSKKPEIYAKNNNVIASRIIGDYSFDIVNDLSTNNSTSITALDLLDKITSAKDNDIISIDTTSSTYVPSKVFKAIQNTNKTIVFESNGVQWYFNGKDIVNPKDIDVFTEIYRDDDEMYNEETDEWEYGKAVVVEFVDNGELPGKALIKVKLDYALKDYLDSEELTVYYYNNEEGYSVISDGLVESFEGYYEFYINHNSKYYLSSRKVPQDKIVNNLVEKLDNKSLVQEIKETNKVVKDHLNKSSNITIYIIIGVVLVACIVAALIIFKKKK